MAEKMRGLGKEEGKAFSFKLHSPAGSSEAILGACDESLLGESLSLKMGEKPLCKISKEFYGSGGKTASELKEIFSKATCANIFGEATFEALRFPKKGCSILFLRGKKIPHLSAILSREDAES